MAHHDVSMHKRTLVKNNRGEGVGQNRQWVLGNLGSVQVRKMKEIGINQSLIYAHLFLTLTFHFLFTHF
jgi:hypothetical protein